MLKAMFVIYVVMQDPSGKIEVQAIHDYRILSLQECATKAYLVMDAYTVDVGKTHASGNKTLAATYDCVGITESSYRDFMLSYMMADPT